MEHEEPHEEKDFMALVPSSMRGGENAWAEPRAQTARQAAVFILRIDAMRKWLRANLRA